MSAQNDIEIGQPRARVGGELGVNGEWYEGGKFLPSKEDRSKQAPAERHELSAEEQARRSARKAEQDAAVARLSAWLEARQVFFAKELAVLESSLQDQWGNRLAGSQNPFHVSLAQDLRASGSVSPKQARYIAKAVFGRQNKANCEAWDALEAALVEEFK